MRTRLRSTIKWGGTVLAVLLLVLWVGSAWWYTGCGLFPTVRFWVCRGYVEIGWDEPWSMIPRDCFLTPPEPHSWAFSWWFDGGRLPLTSGGAVNFVTIPVWVFVLLTAAPAFWLWLRDRRRVPGLCVKCGYDLRRVDHKVCPECGGEVTKK